MAKKLTMKRLSPPSVLALAMLGTALTADGAGGQEAFMIDYDRGRTIIDDPWRAINVTWHAVDRGRGLLYVNDREEPHGVMTFSLSTGERLNTFLVPQGQGPGELEGLRKAELLADGGFYVWSAPKALRFDAMGAVADEWLPERALWSDFCIFAGEPAVAVQGGLLRRDPDGARDERIGAVPDGADVPTVASMDEAIRFAEELHGMRLACSEDAAYVLPYQGGKPDSVLVYSIDGLRTGLPFPSEIVDLPEGAWRGSPDLLADDGRGNLVLLGHGMGSVPAALMDPETGCYAVLRNPTRQLYRDFQGVYADSALVFHWDYAEEMRDGERWFEISDNANRITLHPFEPLGGEPCPSILTSVR